MQVVVCKQRVGFNHTLTPVVLAASCGAVAAAPLHGAVARGNHATDVNLGVVHGCSPTNAVVERVEVVACQHQGGATTVGDIAVVEGCRRACFDALASVVQ